MDPKDCQNKGENMIVAIAGRILLHIALPRVTDERNVAIMDISFENKRILVTSAASGIGKAIALRLAQHPVTVIALDTVHDGLVNISSQASQAGLANHTTYAATKGAVDAFTRSLATELGAKNIRVNPTVVMTTLGRKTWSDHAARYAMLVKIPLQRFAEVDDVVDAVVFLLSDRSSMMSPCRWLIFIALRKLQYGIPN